MKKKVLFALIALFSFVGAWAYEGEAVDVGGYRFYLSQKVVLANDAAPSVNFVCPLDGGNEGSALNAADYSVVSGVYSYTGGVVTPVTTLSGLNYYYLKVQIGSKYYYVPFAVGQTSTDYTIIDSKDAWDASYTAEDGVLKAYYAAYPTEDLFYTGEGQPRAATYNDRYYIGTIGGADAECTVEWTSETVQKLIFGSEAYYATLFYDFEPKACELYTDAALTESANKTFNITTIKYANFEHSWYGAISATNAKYPWVAFKPTISGCKAFGVYKYDTGNVAGSNFATPAGEIIFGTGDGQKAWMVESLPKYFNDNGLAITPGVWHQTSNEYVYEGETAGTFEKTKFQIVLIPAAAPAVVDVEEYNFADATVQVKDKEVYSGKNTKAEILNVELEETTIMPGSCKIVGYREVVNDAPTGNVVEYPNYIGTWVAYVEVENSGNVSYTGTAKSTPFTVTPGQLNVKLTQISKAYGASDPEPAYYIEGWGLGDDQTNTTIEGLDTYTRVDAGEDCYDANGSQIQYTYTLNNAALKAWKNIGTEETPVKKNNYTVTVTEGVLLINPIDLHVNVKNAGSNPAKAEKKYGTDDPDFEIASISAGELKNGDTMNGEKKFWTSIERAAGEAVADNAYAFTVKASNYNVTVDNKFSIKKGDLPAGVVVTIAAVDYKGTAYGADDIPANKVTVTGIATTEPYTLGNFSNNTHAGKASCKATFTNYEGTVDAQFDINKVKLTATGAGTADNPTVTYNGFVNGETATTAKDFVAPTATAVLLTPQSETDKVYEIQLSGGSAADYTFTLVNGTVAVGRTVLHIAAIGTKVYGDADPVLTISKLEERDGEEVRVSGGITVTGWPTEVTLEEQEAILKQSGSKYVFNYSIANPHVNVGTYDINFAGPRVLNEDYAIQYDRSTFTITPAPLTITVDDISKVYGAAVPTLTATVTGLKNGDTEAQAGLVNGTSGYYVSLEPEYTWTNNSWVKRTGWYNNHNYEREHVTTTGHEYPISIGTLSGLSNNYRIENVTPGKMSVTPATLTITPQNCSKTYGDVDPDFYATANLTITGWVGYETAGNNRQNQSRRENVLGTGNNRIYEVTRVAGEDVKEGGYAITAKTKTGATLPQDYTIEYVNNAVLTINKRNVTVTARHQAINYGETINPYFMDVNFGLNNSNNKTLTKGEDVFYQGASVNNTPIVKDEVKDVISLKAKHTEVGSFGEGEENGNGAYTAEYGAKAANYNITFVDGWEVINPAKVLYLDMANLAQALQDHIGRTVEVRLCGAPEKEEGCDPFRQFVAYQWNTLVLPFTAMPREISAAFRYAFIDILDVDNEKETSLSLTQTAKRIPANTPFIFQTDKNWRYGAAADADPTNITFGKREIADFDYLKKNPEAKDKAGNKFIGTYKPNSDFTASNYIMKENTGEFFKFVAGADGVEPSYAMRQTEAYLEAKAGSLGAPVRIIIDNEDGTTTVIDYVEAEGAVENVAEGWYTITGVKLDAEPTTTGTYIFNGKKVFIQK